MKREEPMDDDQDQGRRRRAVDRGETTPSPARTDIARREGVIRLRELKESTDQCWDLLRQRRARREFGLNPYDVMVRDRETVANYRQ